MSFILCNDVVAGVVCESGRTIRKEVQVAFPLIDAREVSQMQTAVNCMVFGPPWAGKKETMAESVSLV
jgi:hypothetical protein